MTFREAFESGYRFKLPKNYSDSSDWPDYWWIYKKPESNKIYFTDDKDRTITIWEFFREEIPGVNKNIYFKYLKSKDWYLHPDDLRLKEFNEKLEKIINE